MFHKLRPLSGGSVETIEITEGFFAASESRSPSHLIADPAENRASSVSASRAVPIRYP